MFHAKDVLADQLLANANDPSWYQPFSASVENLSEEEILQKWNTITKEIEADIVVLDMPLLETTQYRDSLETFIADLVPQILSWMAQKELNRICKRQREGIDAALNNGISFGRSKAQISQEFIEAYDRWKRKEITAV